MLVGQYLLNLRLCPHKPRRKQHPLAVTEITAMKCWIRSPPNLTDQKPTNFSTLDLVCMSGR